MHRGVHMAHASQAEQVACCAHTPATRTTLPPKSQAEQGRGPAAAPTTRVLHAGAPHHLAVAEAGAAGGHSQEVHGLGSQVGAEGRLATQAAEDQQPGAAGCAGGTPGGCRAGPGQHVGWGRSMPDLASRWGPVQCRRPRGVSCRPSRCVCWVGGVAMASQDSHTGRQPPAKQHHERVNGPAHEGDAAGGGDGGIEDAQLGDDGEAEDKEQRRRDRQCAEPLVGGGPDVHAQEHCTVEGAGEVVCRPPQSGGAGRRRECRRCGAPHLAAGRASTIYRLSRWT